MSTLGHKKAGSYRTRRTKKANSGPKTLAVLTMRKPYLLQEIDSRQTTMERIRAAAKAIEGAQVFRSNKAFSTVSVKLPKSKFDQLKIQCGDLCHVIEDHDYIQLKQG